MGASANDDTIGRFSLLSLFPLLGIPMDIKKGLKVVGDMVARGDLPPFGGENEDGGFIFFGNPPKTEVERHQRVEELRAFYSK